MKEKGRSKIERTIILFKAKNEWDLPLGPVYRSKMRIPWMFILSFYLSLFACVAPQGQMTNMGSGDQLSVEATEWFARGKTSFLRDEYDEAVQRLDRAITLAPKYAQA